jgi:hypothetical protein
MKQEQIKEDGPVAAPTNVTAGVEGPKLPIKSGNVFKRVQALKKKKKNPTDRDAHEFI